MESLWCSSHKIAKEPALTPEFSFLGICSTNTPAHINFSIARNNKIGNNLHLHPQGTVCMHVAHRNHKLCGHKNNEVYYLMYGILTKTFINAGSVYSTLFFVLKKKGRKILYSLESTKSHKKVVTQICLRGGKPVDEGYW